MNQLTSATGNVILAVQFASKNSPMEYTCRSPSILGPSSGYAKLQNIFQISTTRSINNICLSEKKIYD